IEGLAFEQDAGELVRATEAGRSVTAVLDMAGERPEAIEGLAISHISNEVARDSRSLHFYIRLPNTVVRDAVRDDGRHFLSWRFKPGQRMQLRVPVEEWTEAIVLPVSAVAEDAVESYVFVENGRRFERRPVYVAHRDSLYAVIANDGSLFPGE